MVPIVLVEISLCPNSSSDLDIRLINFSVVSVSIGLFFKAMKIDLASLSLSNEIFFHFFYYHNFSILNSFKCSKSFSTSTNLLLLIAVPSSVGLESTTEVSPFFSYRADHLFKFL